MSSSISSALVTDVHTVERSEEMLTPEHGGGRYAGADDRGGQ